MEQSLEIVPFETSTSIHQETMSPTESHPVNMTPEETQEEFKLKEFFPDSTSETPNTLRDVIMNLFEKEECVALH